MKKLPVILVFLFTLVGASPRLLAQGTTAPEAFNVADYENIYPDLLNVYGLDTYDATVHWINWGLSGGRRANAIFDAQYYLANNPDLQAAFGPTLLTSAL